MVEKDRQVLLEDRENLVLRELKEEMEFLVHLVRKECKVKREILDFKDCQEYQEKMELM